MTRAEAARLFALLAANWPRTKITEETAGLWLDALVRLDATVGESAVRSLLASQKYWPAVAHLNEAVTVAVEQAAREARSAERRAAEAAFDLLPRPPLRDIPAAVEMIARFTGSVPLELAPDGGCDDGCGHTGIRYRFGSFQVCADCARRRLQARERAA